jgi:hypothetical protein
MNKPKIGKIYIFVRQSGDTLEHTEFIRYEDSAGFAADGFHHVHENHPEAWRNALNELASLGFMEINEARAAGRIPSDWEPTPETYTLKHNQTPTARKG